MSEKGVQITYGDGFEALLGVLASSRRPGSWYAHGALETPMPAVEVAGVGMLSFPVPAAQARQLIENAAERAPYGKGDQTLVDENVRKVWQISPAKVSISGKGWAVVFEELVREIAEDLGCEGVGVEAQFYKLLVYEKGSFFLSHRDSEKAGGMFGTLVVALPSAHEGGELVVRHAGREAVLELCGSAPSEIQFAAFYADCEHEVRPVRAGYRVCLIYNLVLQKRKKPLAPPDHRRAIAAATPLLAQWASGGEGPDKIVHLFEHRYTQAALSFSALKGADAALAQVLVPAAVQAGCAAHLGIVHIEESGWAEHTAGGYYGRRHRRSRWDDDDDAEEFDVGEVCDGAYYIDQWRAPEDAPVNFGEIPIGQGEILPPGALDGEPPDESHFSEATGNEGASFERTYLRAALVIWPENRFDRICASAGPDAALARLEQLVGAAKKLSGAKRQEATEAVSRLARALPPLDDYGSGKGERVSRLLDALRRFGDVDLLVEVVEPQLLDLYEGLQNRALLAAVPMLGEKRAAALLAAVVRARGPLFPYAVIELWTSLAKRHAKSRPLLDSTLDALLEAIARYSPPKSSAWASWSRYRHLDLDDEFEKSREPKPLSPATVSSFLTGLHASPCEERMNDAIRGIMEKPDLFTPEKVLLPALEKLAIPAANGPADIWAHCAQHYLQRSERPPEPPRDWTQNVTLPGKSPLIRELEAFARDPQAHVHRFRVRKDLRQEIHRAIDRAGLDMTHVTERSGSPQTLVCTKTHASYERALTHYQSDLTDMRRLLALPPARSKNNGALTQRLRRATAQSKVHSSGLR
jgi:2OG-Fe(II) oxygenase superfamily